MSRIAPIVFSVAALACGGAGGSSAIIDPPAPVVTSVMIASNALSLVPGASTRLSAEARDANGASIAGTTIMWATSAPTVATVSSDGTVTAVDGGTAAITASAGGKSASVTATVDYVYDLATRGVPKLITSDYIDLAKISRISRFRSGIGHDYSDDAERCRSMKHYFQPSFDLDWGSIIVSAPAPGTIADVQAEMTSGEQVRITPSAYPAVTIIVFHVRRDAGIAVGTIVAAGQRLGTHVGGQTMSDVAIRVRTIEGMRYVSYFDAMSDAVFERYVARGISSREALIISARDRDASALTCDGEQFQGSGSLANWVDLP